MRKNIPLLALTLLLAVAAGVGAAVVLFSSSVKALPSCAPNNNGCLVAVKLLASSQSASEAYSLFSEELKGDAKLRNECHTFAHEAGKLIWYKFGESSFIPGGGDCAFGVYHGVMQAIAVEEPKTFHETSNRLCGVLAAVNKTQGEECVHGIGHALGLASGSLSEALEGCVPLGGVNMDKCLNGAGMEYFGSQPLQTDLLALCDPVSDVVKGNCIESALPRTLIRLKQDWGKYDCSKYDQKFLANCMRGLGSALGTYVTRDWYSVEETLQAEPCWSNIDCFATFIVTYTSNKADIAAGERLCLSLGEAERQAKCRTAIDIVRNLYRDTGSGAIATESMLVTGSPTGG